MERGVYPAMLVVRKDNPTPYVVMSFRLFDPRPIRFSIGPFLCPPTPVGCELKHNIHLGFPGAYLQSIPRAEGLDPLPSGRLLRFELEVGHPGTLLYLHLIDNDGIVQERIQFDWARRQARVEESSGERLLVFAGAYAPI